MVTLKDLKEYRFLLKEIRDLKRRLNQHERVVTDVVVASSSQPPYIKHPVSVTGYDYYCSIKLYNKYVRKLELLQHKAEEIEDYISTIEDSLVRQIIRLRFIDGLSWRAVAFKIGGGHTEESVRKIFVRFMGKQAEKSQK